MTLVKITHHQSHQWNHHIQLLVQPQVGKLTASDKKLHLHFSDIVGISPTSLKIVHFIQPFVVCKSDSYKMVV